MKKLVFFFAALFVTFIAITGCASARYREEKYVTAIYLANDKQSFADQTAESLLDALWIFFSDASFEQYAVYPDGSIRIFISGKYKLNGEASPDCEFVADRQIELTVNDEARTYTLSEHFGSKLFEKTNTTKHVLSIFVGNDRQPYPAEDGSKDFLDTVWLYYSDTTFDQYAILPEGNIVLFSTGLYKLPGKRDVVVRPGKKVTLHRTKKYKRGEGLLPYHSTHVYGSELNDFVLVYARKG